MLKNNFEEINSESPFFIFGCGRSGTSLLSRMLNQHSRLAVPYESHLFNTFLPLLDHYGDLTILSKRKRLIEDILRTDVMNDWEPKLDVETVLSKVSDYSFGGIFNSIMESYTIKSGKKRWGEKTPHHIYYWDEIIKIWPNAKIIHIYRDGRDVALSLLNARFGPKTIYSNAKYWVKYLDQVNIVKNKIDRDTLIQVSYEDLLDNSEFELNKICDFIGEKFESKMLEFYKNTADYKTDVQNTNNLKKPIIKDNKYKWRKKMNNKEIRLFESIAGTYLKNYGYSLENLNPSVSNYEHFFYGKILSPIKKIYAMLKNKKGHRDSIIKILIKTKLLFLK